MKTTLKYSVLVCILSALFALSSCEEKGGSILPGVTGKFGEIYVVVDKPLWDSEIGDTLRGIFTEEYPMLPQPEAMFKLMSVPYDNFSRAFQRHRNLIVINISPEVSETKIDLIRDRWATPQFVINVVGPDAHNIAKTLYEQQDKMIAYIEQAELDRQSSNAIKYEDPALREAAERKFGIRMFIPQGFRMLPVDPYANFLWYTNRTTYVDMGIFIYTYPFVSDSTFTVDYLVNKRNEFLKQYVPGALDSTWMITSPVLKPDLQIKSFKGMTYGEMRGLWDVENDFMGGPFISRSYVDNANHRIVTVEGYVYAPRYDKRDYMRRLEGIINTLTLTVPTNDSAEIDSIKGQKTSSISFQMLMNKNTKKYYADNIEV